MNSIVVLLAAAILAAPAHASPPCPTTIGDGRAISLEGQGKDYLAGLEVSVLLGLSPVSFPYDQVGGRDVCTRGEFEAAGETFRGYGRMKIRRRDGRSDRTRRESSIWR